MQAGATEWRQLLLAGANVSDFKKRTARFLSGGRDRGDPPLPTFVLEGRRSRGFTAVATYLGTVRVRLSRLRSSRWRLDAGSIFSGPDRIGVMWRICDPVEASRLWGVRLLQPLFCAPSSSICKLVPRKLSANIKPFCYVAGKYNPILFL